MKAKYFVTEYQGGITKMSLESSTEKLDTPGEIVERSM